MYLLGVAILIKTEEDYKGTIENINKGELYVSYSKRASMEHYSLHKAIYKVYKEFPSQMPNATFGYVAIDDFGKLLFVDRREASNAYNIINKTDNVLSSNVKWDKENSRFYENEYKYMVAYLKNKHNINEEDIEGDLW